MIEGTIRSGGAKGLGGELPGHVHYGIQGPPGGHYIPEVKQTDGKTAVITFTASKPDMPAVVPVEIELPVGPQGDSGKAYILTAADRAEIAEMAADLVEVPDSCGNAGHYPDWSHLKWYVMGDSLTAKANDKRYYDFVQEKTGIQTVVDGVGGTGYGAGVSNNQSFLDRVKNIPADVDIVTIFGSGNDIRYEVDYNTPIYNTLAWIAFNRPGMRVIVFPPSPWKGYQKRSETWKAYCDRLQVCALACDFRYLSDMWECPPFNPNFEGHMEKFFTTDPEGIHPNEAGHEALAPYFYNALAQELALKV